MLAALARFSCLRWHPDKNADNLEVATEAMCCLKSFEISPGLSMAAVPKGLVSQGVSRHAWPTFSMLPKGVPAA